MSTKFVNSNNLETLARGLYDRVDTRLDGKSFKYLTVAEYEELSDDEKNDDSIVYQITDKQLSYNDLVDKPEIPSIEGLASEEYVMEALGGKQLRYVTSEEYEALSEAEKDREDILYQITDGELSFNDLVDVPDFALSENLNDYLPLSGGTVTGEIKLVDGSSSDGFTSLSYTNEDGLNIITETSNSQTEVTFGFNLNCDNIDMAAVVEEPELATNPLAGAVTIGILSDNSVYVSADNFNGDLAGNAESATKLVEARKIGNATFDGTADITLAEMGVPNITILTQAEYDAIEGTDAEDPDTFYLISDEL